MSTDDIRCRIMEEELGTFWPQWHVVKRLGGGAFGDVFEIFRDNHGVPMYSALKVLRISDREEAFAVPLQNDGWHKAGERYKKTGKNDIPEVFMNEIRIMEALRGAPNIVSIDDFYFRKGTDTSSLYVRMELLISFIDVVSDRQKKGRPFTITEVLKIGKDICTALSFCEQRNIIHRDIKPANLFVDKFGNFKVGDFGASKLMETIHPAHMLTGIGTISYMAPEIFAGRIYNNTVDIYALGLVLYQLLNYGRMPFLPAKGHYTVQDIDAANYKRLHGEEIPSLVGIRVCGETIGTHLNGVIRKACDPDSHRRYQTAREFFDALSDQEARSDSIESISEAERTSERGNRELYKRNARTNGPAAAERDEKAYARKEAEIQQVKEKKSKPLFFASAAILLAAALIIVGVRSNFGHNNPIQSATTGSEGSTNTDKTESAASEDSEQSVSTESQGSVAVDENENSVLKSPVQSVSLGYYHSAAISIDGSLWMWGRNDVGQLADGISESISKPVKITERVQTVSLGEKHSAIIKTDGSLWMWGWNEYGQLGDDSTVDQHEPIKIMEGVQSVLLGSRHSAAIKTDGSLWMWGWNEAGQLGDGSTVDRHKPVKIMEGVQSVSLGEEHSAAIKTDGSLWVWGFNRNPMWREDIPAFYYEPVKIMEGVQSVSLGPKYSAAIKTDGSLWTWGYNNYGQLGDGSKKTRFEPEKILDEVQSVSLGGYHGAAIKTDGSLWMWGNNNLGQLGDNSTEDRYEPVKIMEGVQSVSLGLNNSMAIKEDGSVWAWGQNMYSKLGDGSTEEHHIPVCIVE